MGDDVIAFFKNLVKSRINVDFHFYKLTRAIESFIVCVSQQDSTKSILKMLLREYFTATTAKLTF